MLKRKFIIPPIAIIFLWIIIFAYSLAAFGRVVYKNYQINQQIRKLEAEISSIQQQNAVLTNLIEYYKSETYAEIEARAKLGLKKKGEIAVALPSKNNENESTDILSGEINSSYESRPNYLKWYDFFAGRE
jgi:cell division protein FtsB